MEWKIEDICLISSIFFFLVYLISKATTQIFEREVRGIIGIITLTFSLVCISIFAISTVL